ncbi:MULTISPECIES: acetylornithine deacetylase [unclassified Bradyrhizobium]|uniref:acetylornithine deacetylase n=1 Tax=unclassified Bradyrhizobium TaxID=2631580 RepID=UPI0028E5E45E|nr:MULTISPECIES: acetylornithine deacetylase [unclassified Bradyrhizobium]
MNARLILRELIAFDTSTPNSNLPLVHFVANLLDRPGCTIRLSYDDSRSKANLICAVGPTGEDGILLSGHSDVVGVDGQAWTGNPFVLRETAGRLYGRGACDMKGFIACCLERMIKLSPDRLRRPLYLALSYDEELGCVGVPRLIADLQHNFPRPALAIVGEPTQMRVVSAHKGVFVMRTSFRGRAAHSSNPAAGLSAIDYAHRFVAFLADLAEEFKEQRSRSGVAPPYTTLNVGTIQGGTSLNTVAPSCTLVWEFRPIPEVDGHAICGRVERFIDNLRQEMRDIVPDADAVNERLGIAFPLRWEANSSAEASVERLTGSAVIPTAVPFGTDAGYFQAAGIPTLVMGPGSIEQAHQPDEWIAASELQAATDFLDRVAAAIAN